MRESQESYRRIVDLSPDGIFVSQNGRIAFLNPAALRLCGASAAEQVLGQPLFQMFDRVNASALDTGFSGLAPGQSDPPFEATIIGIDEAATTVEKIVT